MSILNNSLLLGADAGVTEYQISRSLRFNSSDSAYLSRTPSTAGNRKTWTWAGWVKRGLVDANYRTVFSSGSAVDNVMFWNNYSFAVRGFNGANYELITQQVFRDPSAWYHLVLAMDTTQATSTNRIKLYVNGTQVTNYATATYPSQNFDTGVNSTTAHYIAYNTFNYYDGYLADIHFIDGQALTPSDFTETDATTGQLVPIAYIGTYGTNGFHLDFADNSAATATTLGKDTSGNGNNWTPNNLSVSAGAGNDSLVDTPTSYGTDTGAGGDVRGNYCTLNSLANNGGTLSNGNYDHSGVTALTTGTLFPSSGKWYFEVTCNTYSGGGSLGYTAVGVIKSDQSINTVPTSVASVPSGLWVYRNDAVKINNGTSVSYGNTWTAGDVIGIAFDVDGGKVWFAKNGTWQASGDPAAGTNAAYTNLSGSIGVAINDQSIYTTTYSLNTGARAFAYTAPSGYKALCTTNLPEPTIADGSTAMDAVLYTGNGLARDITGYNFSPDLVWIKSRSAATDHGLYDIVRGVQKNLSSNNTSQELDYSPNYLSAFNSDGFSIGGAGAYVNTNASTYVAWAWDAGSSTVTNTQGSITSSVRANASAGFSIVTASVSASASGPTIGHGLGVTPALVIGKNRSAGIPWYVWSSSLAANNKLVLNSTAAAVTDTNTWGTMTSSTLQMGATGTGVSTAWIVAGTQDVVFYCFAPVAGYSSFGSYTGNGSADGPFVYTGFRTAFVLIKCSSSNQSGNAWWLMYDYKRLGYNPNNTVFGAQVANAEYDAAMIDLTSNGFKIRDANTSRNASGATYIYAAFAENPFQFSRAR